MGALGRSWAHLLGGRARDSNAFGAECVGRAGLCASARVFLCGIHARAVSGHFLWLSLLREHRLGCDPIDCRKVLGFLWPCGGGFSPWLGRPPTCPPDSPCHAGEDFHIVIMVPLRVRAPGDQPGAGCTRVGYLTYWVCPPGMGQGAHKYTDIGTTWLRVRLSWLVGGYGLRRPWLSPSAQPLGSAPRFSRGGHVRTFVLSLGTGLSRS